MSMWRRILNVFRGDRLNREIDEEFESHIQEAIEQGRDPAEVRKAFGSAMRRREESRDVRLAATHQNKSNFCCRYLIAGSRHWRVHVRIPLDRCAAFSAVAHRERRTS